MKKILLIVSLICWYGEIFSQVGDYAYVQGPEYKVLNCEEGPRIFWEGEPIGDDQVEYVSDVKFNVLEPTSKMKRLIIYLYPNGKLKDVVDLAYQADPDQPALADRPAPADPPFDWYTPREVTFVNGLKFTYDGEDAYASLGSKQLPISGSRGNYRIVTDEFEAGVSFGPRYGANIYHYFTEK